jgi:HAD superfamily hydrolase (TIGR01459 family)
MPGPKPLASFAEIAPGYPAVLCDVWGVVHNSIEADTESVAALARYRAGGGRVLLITNAPRAARFVEAQLDQLGVSKDAYDGIVSSGDMTRAELETRGALTITYIGTPPDRSLYEGLPITEAAPEEAAAVLCAGFFNDREETPEDYRERLAPLAARGLEMICANPDIVVERGDRLVYCAGSLARLYEELGGRASRYGKPHAAIYAGALARLSAVAGRPFERSEILVIGDGLPTDIAGAQRHGFDALFVTGGIHADDLHRDGRPDHEAIAARLAAEGFEVAAYMPRLVW